jgi:hypothetical protein
MGRIRTIKPEFPQSESMGRVSRDARLCFVLMWTLADDEGRLRGNSRMLASLLFPYDDDAPGLIGDWLDELDRDGCIERYEAAGSSYIQIANWLSHQKIDKPSASKIPPIEDASRILANPRESSSLDQGPRTKDQGRDQGKDHSGAKAPSVPKPQKADAEDDPDFIEAWKAYPRRPGDSRADAFKAWRARLKEGKTVEAMKAGVRRYAGFCAAEGVQPQYIKQGATFFGPGLHFEAEWEPGGQVGKSDGSEASRARTTAGALRLLGIGDQETIDA